MPTNTLISSQNVGIVKPLHESRDPHGQRLSKRSQSLRIELGQLVQIPAAQSFTEAIHIREVACEGQEAEAQTSDINHDAAGPPADL